MKIYLKSEKFYVNLYKSDQTLWKYTLYVDGITPAYGITPMKQGWWHALTRTHSWKQIQGIMSGLTPVRGIAPIGWLYANLLQAANFVLFFQLAKKDHSEYYAYYAKTKTIYNWENLCKCIQLLSKSIKIYVTSEKI